jgi:hypothetical protein
LRGFWVYWVFDWGWLVFGALAGGVNVRAEVRRREFRGGSGGMDLGKAGFSAQLRPAG